MDARTILIALAIGAVAGWLAGVIMRGGGFGLIGDIVLGILGAFIGGYIFGLLKIQVNSLIGTLVMSTVGAVVLLGVIRIFRRG